MLAISQAMGTVPISYVSSAGANGTSIGSMPAHQPGDLLLMGALRDLNSAPGLASGWSSVLIHASSSGNYAIRVGALIAATSSETSGTWSNAVALTCLVYRQVSAVGASAATSGYFSAYEPIPIPSLSLQQTGGHSWVAMPVFMYGNTLPTSSVGGNPRRIRQVTGANLQLGCYDTDEGVSSWSGDSLTMSAASNYYISAAVELKRFP